MSTIGVAWRSRIRRAWRSAPSSVAPEERARRVVSWITGPSASGSLNGTPSSSASAPSSHAAKARRSDSVRSGNPEVRKGRKAPRRSSRAVSNARPIRSGTSAVQGGRAAIGFAGADRKLLLVVRHAEQAVHAGVVRTEARGLLEREDRLIGGILVVVRDTQVVVEPGV